MYHKFKQRLQDLTSTRSFKPWTIVKSKSSEIVTIKSGLCRYRSGSRRDDGSGWALGVISIKQME